jgi:hypothetical protein
MPSGLVIDGPLLAPRRSSSSWARRGESRQVRGRPGRRLPGRLPRCASAVTGRRRQRAERDPLRGAPPYEGGTSAPLRLRAGAASSSVPALLFDHGTGSNAGAEHGTADAYILREATSSTSVATTAELPGVAADEPRGARCSWRASNRRPTGRDRARCRSGAGCCRAAPPTSDRGSPRTRANESTSSAGAAPRRSVPPDRTRVLSAAITAAGGARSGG